MNKKLIMVAFAVMLIASIGTAAVVSYLSNTATVSVTVDSPMSIENKDVLSKIFKNCKSFYKGNKKESAFSKEACDGIEGVFERVEAKEFVLEDAVWIRIVFVPYLKNRCLALKIGFMGRVLR